MQIKKITIYHKNLSKSFLRKIIKLKKQEWKYSYKSQKNWIKKNFLNNDIHILVFVKKELAGYTALRLKKFSNNNENYYYFDTHVVLNKFKGIFLKKEIKISKILMDEVFKIQKKTKKVLVLLSKKLTFNYYKNQKWKRVPKKNYEIKKKNLFLFVYPISNFNKKFNIKL
jgi:hypothetical protein